MSCLQYVYSHLKIILAAGIMLIPFTLLGQSVTTNALPADINDSQIVNAEVSSVLDGSDQTHIAWFRQIDSTRTLMYTLYDNSTFQTTALSSYTNGVPVATQIIVDQNGNPHIVYIVKRDSDAGTKSGNYAIMYAGDDNGDGSFTENQISTNADNPEDDTANDFNAYVNGRPAITLTQGGDIVVYYTGDSHSDNSYDNNLVKAVKNGSSWDHSLAFNIDTFVEGTYDIDAAFSAPVNMGSTPYLATIDISDYRPQFYWESNGNWSKTVLSEFSGVFDDSDVHLATQNDGTVHMMWMNESEDPERFVHTTLDGSSYTTPEFTAIQDNLSGNLFGYAVDAVSGDIYYAYGESFSDDVFLIAFNENGVAVETEILDVGEFYGKRSMHVNDGFISIVTADDGNGEIYVTTADAATVTSAEREGEDIPAGIVLKQNYPNPFNPTTRIRYSLPVNSHTKISVYNTLGQEMAVLVNDFKSSGTHEVIFNANDLNSGLYFYRIEAKGFTQTRKMMLVK